MLILSRKLEESVIINDNIVLTILEIKGDTVRIGVEAPPEVKILRSEIYEAIKRENITASKSSPDELEEIIQ